MTITINDIKLRSLEIDWDRIKPFQSSYYSTKERKAKLQSEFSLLADVYKANFAGPAPVLSAKCCEVLSELFQNMFLPTQ